jgi:hypothetical protein
MPTPDVEKRNSFLQYINTGILTLIAIFATMIFITVGNIRDVQVDQKAEMLRLKTIQDINVSAIKSVESRVSTLELNYLDYIKNWVDQNYVRKPQK